MNYYDRANNALMKAYGRFDVTFDHGKGVYLYDTNGKKYLDFYSGIGVNSFGYDYQPYSDALTNQIHRLMHISNYFNSVEAIEAAEAVIKATKLDQVFFTNSGTEATEGALKLARKYYYEKHGKADSEIISLKHSFHGRSTGSVTLTGTPAYQTAFGPLIEGVKYGEINDLESVENLITSRTAAIILEPVQGEGGIHVCSQEFMQGIRNLCDEHDIVMILDEVQCGMGRTGTIMTYFQYGIMPDVVCLAKGIGAGFPMGAFVANEKVGSALKPGDHGSTYGGNPMAGCACKTVFKIIEEKKMLEHVQDISEYLISKLDELVDKYDCIKERRGLGLMIGLEFVHPIKPYIQKALDKGLVLITAGSHVIRMLPPFIIEEKDVDEMIKIFTEVIEEVNS